MTVSATQSCGASLTGTLHFSAFLDTNATSHGADKLKQVQSQGPECFKWNEKKYWIEKIVSVESSGTLNEQCAVDVCGLFQHDGKSFCDGSIR